MQVSVPGFGAATLGGEYGALDPAAAQREVDVTIDRGVDSFDVSPYYGRTLAEGTIRASQGRGAGAPAS